MALGISLEQLKRTPDDTSHIRWFMRLAGLLGGDTINLSIGQCRHEPPQKLQEALSAHSTTLGLYPPFAGTLRHEEVIAGKMMLTHFTGVDGKPFGRTTDLPGAVIPDFYAGDNAAKGKHTAITNSGASGGLTAVYTYAAQQGIRDFTFTVPFFDPYDKVHLRGVEATLEQQTELLLKMAGLPQEKTEALRAAAKINKHYVSTLPSYHMEGKALAALESNLRGIDAQGKKACLVLCSPNNPTGHSYSMEEWKNVIRTVNGIQNLPLLVLDEPYDFLTFQQTQASKNSPEKPIEVEWRQHISITHALNEMVNEGSITKERASQILDNVIFLNSPAKGPAAAALGGGYMWTVNSQIMDGENGLRAIVARDQGPLRLGPSLAIEHGVGHFVEQPETMKELSRKYGELVMTLARELNRVAFKQDIVSTRTGKKAFLAYEPSGSIYFNADCSALINKEIPDNTDAGRLFREYKMTYGNKTATFDSAEDIGLYLLLEARVAATPEDGTGTPQVLGNTPTSTLRFSLGEIGLEKVAEVPKRVDHAFGIVMAFNKAHDRQFVASM